MTDSWRVAVVISLLVAPVTGQGSLLKPPTTLKLEGVPEIPTSLSEVVQRYRASSPDSMVGWDPDKVEPVFIRHHYNRLWELSRVATLGGPVTRFRALPIGSYGAYQNPRRRYFVFNVDIASGAERIQLIGYNADSGALVQLTDGISKNENPVFSNSGEMMMYSSNRRNRKHMDIYLVNPRDPSSNRMVAQLDGEDWTALDWSQDDRKVILSDYQMSSETHLWILDVETGMKSRLTAPLTARVFNGAHAQFSEDGRGVFHITDRDSEFRRLAYVDIATRRYTYLTSKPVGTLKSSHFHRIVR